MGTFSGPSKGRHLGPEYQRESELKSLSACWSWRNAYCPHFLWITLWMMLAALDYLREKRRDFAFGAKPSQSENSIETMA